MTNEPEEGEVDDFSDGEIVDSPEPVKKLKSSKKHKKRKRDNNRDAKDDGKQPDHKKVKKKPLDSKCGNLKLQKCKYYMEGRCSKGDECTFSHDFNPPRRPELCRYYVTGNCGKGDQCVYYHEEFPCRYFHTGTCRHGTNCRFSHEPLTPFTKEMLDKSLQETYNENQNGHDEGQEPIKDHRGPVIPGPLPLREPQQPMFGSLPPYRPPMWNGPPRPFRPPMNGHPQNPPMNSRPMIPPPAMRQPFMHERMQMGPRGPPLHRPINMQGNHFSSDMDYRTPPNRNPSPMHRFPPTYPQRPLPSMLQKPPMMPPLRLPDKRDNNSFDDEIGKLAAIITSKPSNNNDEKKSEEITPEIRVNDPRLSKSSQPNPDETKPTSTISKSLAERSNVFGGLLKQEVVWRLFELDLENHSIFHHPNPPEPNDPRSNKGVNILLAATSVKHTVSLTESETDTSTEKAVEPEPEPTIVIPPKSNESRRPYRIQLNQMASTVISNQEENSATKTTASNRSYLSDGRFKRRKIVPSVNTSQTSGDDEPEDSGDKETLKT